MTPEEGRQKLFEIANKDTNELREVLDEYRMDKGIPVGVFVELLAMIAQEYRLIRQYVIPRPK